MRARCEDAVLHGEVVALSKKAKGLDHVTVGRVIVRYFCHANSFRVVFEGSRTLALVIHNYRKLH